MALAAVLTAAAPAKAAIIYVESTNGDFSNNRASPTSVAFGVGQNDIFGETGSTAGVTDRDYFTFVVPVGYTLSALTVLNSELSGGAAAFFGLQAGSQITVDPAAPVATPLLGYFLVAPATIGMNILPAMGMGLGAIGFTGPLAAGQYSAWLQDTNLAPSRYGLRFDVTPVPEPGTALLALTGLAALGRFRRRRG